MHDPNKQELDLDLKLSPNSEAGTDSDGEFSLQITKQSILRQERNRLGLSQSEFGALCGVSGRTVIKWENHETSPDLKQLTALSKFGLDLSRFNYNPPRSYSMDRYTFAEIRFADCPNGSQDEAMKAMSIKFHENPKYKFINVESMLNSNGEQIGIRYFYKYVEMLIPEKLTFASTRP